VPELVPFARLPEEPGAVIPHAGICVGGGGSNRRTYLNLQRKLPFCCYRSVEVKLGTGVSAVWPNAPQTPAGSNPLVRGQIAEPPSLGWRVMWLGHASFLLQGAGLSLLAVVMHWGTIHLTDEPLGEPPLLLAEASVDSLLDPGVFVAGAIGHRFQIKRCQHFLE